MRTLLLACVLAGVATCALAQQATPSTAIDTDRDGLSDDLENDLLLQFLPSFMIGSSDCSAKPAQFKPEASIPTVVAEDGSIYGQAFPRKDHSGQVELHYYHLWRRDCGEMGHALDAEHVSALVEKSGPGATWKALYWYAAAHEDTVCDASQITRARTIHAELDGARVWISEGKHASFLSEDLCTHGCGGDQCQQMTQLRVEGVINLGEAAVPMSGAVWSSSGRWPLDAKLRRTDFTDARIDRLERLPGSDVAWANPSKRPAQSAILGANVGIGGAVTGARATDTALTMADAQTSEALGHATDNTTHAVAGAMRNVGKALRKSAQKTGEALGVESKPAAEQ